MARRARPLDPAKPLEAFAADLRRLRDSAPPRRPKATGPEPLGVDHVVAKHGVGRSSIYAALGARRLPSRTLLRAMVLAWDPEGEAAMARWMDRRREVEEALGLDESATGRSAAGGSSAGAAKPAASEGDRSTPTGRAAPSKRPQPVGDPSASSASSVPSALRAEVRRLYEAAGSPSLSAISTAVLADSQSSDISPETVRRVVAGARAKQNSVMSVVRALASLGGDDATGAEERARQLHDLEQPEAEVRSEAREDTGEPPRVDLRGAVIYSLQLTAGDGQIIDLRNSVLNAPVLQAGDQQTIRISGHLVGGVAVQAGDQQVVRIGGDSVGGVAVQAGDQQTVRIGGSVRPALPEGAGSLAPAVGDSGLLDSPHFSLEGRAAVPGQLPRRG